MELILEAQARMWLSIDTACTRSTTDDLGALSELGRMLNLVSRSSETDFSWRDRAGVRSSSDVLCEFSEVDSSISVSVILVHQIV